MRSLNAYITILGRSIWALLNTYYAVQFHERYLPDVVWIVTEEIYREKLGKVEAGLASISRAYGFTPGINSLVVTQGDWLRAGEEIQELVETLKSDGYGVALDITPGRKALVAGALLSTAETVLDHVYYLMIDRLDDAAKPYTMIPFQVQHLTDLVTGVKEE